jgi:hypothetical protein
LSGAFLVHSNVRKVLSGAFLLHANVRNVLSGAFLVHFNVREVLSGAFLVYTIRAATKVTHVILKTSALLIHHMRATSFKKVLYVLLILQIAATIKVIHVIFIT